MTLASLRMYCRIGADELPPIAEDSNDTAHATVGRSDCGSKLPAPLLLIQIVTPNLAEDDVKAIAAQVVRMFQSQTALSLIVT